MRVRHGFTLIEVLVVVAIVALLMALLLPALEQARQVSWETRCKSNQHQMALGWEIALRNNKHQIPVVRPQLGVAKTPTWASILEDAMPKIHREWANPADPAAPHQDPMLSCPVVQRRFQGMYYTGWSYAANGLWTNVPREWNTFKNWDKIVHHSQYPWFVDAQPYTADHGLTYSIYTYVPCTITTYFSSPTWGLGFHHAGGRVCNVEFADGHVGRVQRSELGGPDTDPNDLSWFENR